MKKEKWMKIGLLVLPLLVVAVASGPSSVIVFDGENTAYFSWHQVVAKSSLGWCAPVAVMMNYVVFALAVLYFLKKKSWCLTWIFYLAFAAGCVAVLPIVFQSDIKVVPNVAGAILLMAQSFVAKVAMKELSEEQPKEKQGKRLKRR